MIKDIIAYLASIVVFHHHWFSLSQPLRLAFFKRQKGNIQALKQSKSAESSKGCTTRPPPLNYSLALVVLLRSLLSQKNSTPFSNVHFTPYIMYSFGMFIFFGCFQYLFGNNKPVRLQQYSKHSFKNEIYFFSFCSIVLL